MGKSTYLRPANQGVLGSENEPASQENRATMSSGKATPRFGRKRSAIVFCAFFAPVSVNLGKTPNNCKLVNVPIGPLC